MLCPYIQCTPAESGFIARSKAGWGWLESLAGLMTCLNLYVRQLPRQQQGGQGVAILDLFALDHLL